MITILFLVYSVILVVVQSKREKNIVNLISILIAPYIVIVALNNYVFVNFGFYRISDSVLLMLLSTLVVFYLGTLPTAIVVPKIQEKDNELRFDKYHMNAMAIFVTIVGVIGMIKLLLLARSGGLSGDMFNESEGVMGNGIVGHLLLLSYSVLPILFLYWIEHKKEIMFLIPVILIVIVTFSTFVKYNVIGVVVSLFIFITIYKKSSIRKAIIFMVAIVIAIFIGNYYIGFAVRGVSAQSSFYFNHFWTYASGSTIYDNYLFANNSFIYQSVMYKLMIFIMALPNMFITKITGTDGIFRHIRKPFLSISSQGEVSNVTDAIGYLFPAKGDYIEYAVYFILIFVIGFMFSKVYMGAKLKDGYFNTYIINLLTYFIFFSFFGTFYINPGPWEMLVYSLIVPSLFLKSTDLRKGIIHIP